MGVQPAVSISHPAKGLGFRVLGLGLGASAKCEREEVQMGK